MMNRKISVLLSVVGISACSHVAMMEKSDSVQQQPELKITTSGDFWGLGQEGSFSIAGLYKGKYSREASDANWFNTVSIKDGEMVAEITRRDNNKSWQLAVLVAA